MVQIHIVQIFYRFLIIVIVVVNKSSHKMQSLKRLSYSNQKFSILIAGEIDFSAFAFFELQRMLL